MLYEESRNELADWPETYHMCFCPTNPQVLLATFVAIIGQGACAVCVCCVIKLNHPPDRGSSPRGRCS